MQLRQFAEDSNAKVQSDQTEFSKHQEEVFSSSTTKPTAKPKRRTHRN